MKEIKLFDPLDTKESKKELAKKLLLAIPSYIPGDKEQNLYCDELLRKAKKFIKDNNLLDK